MKRVFSALACSAAVLSVAAPAHSQVREVPLARAATELGYSYTYNGFMNAAVVQRPGLTILVRPGQQLAELNDALVSLDAAPILLGGTMYVPASLVAQMKQLARQYPSAASLGERAIVVVTQPTARGAVSLDVRQLLGSYSLAISGKAPPSVPVTLTLIGTFSKDIPDVLLSRSEVASDVDGRFQAVVSVAPGFFSGGLLTLVATSLPGVTRASAQMVMEQPNWKVSVPGDSLQKFKSDGIYGIQQYPL